jgi:uncharacterized membrane protein (UPF0127 family)
VKTILMLLLLAGLASCGDAQPTQRARLLDDDGNTLLVLEIAIADTAYERQEGLRLHGPLAKNQALLMVFPKETQVCLTNTGVPYPIDALYLSPTGQVTAAEPNIPAQAPGPYCHPAQQVLELQGDTLPPLNYAKLELF